MYGCVSIHDTDPTEDDPDPGPECPDCGAETEWWLHPLTEKEHTSIISCTECEFRIESMSNLAARDRREQFDVDDWPSLP